MCNKHSFIMDQHGEILHLYGLSEHHSSIHEFYKDKHFGMREGNYYKFEYDPYNLYRENSYPDAPCLNGLKIDNDRYCQPRFDLTLGHCNIIRDHFNIHNYMKMRGNPCEFKDEYIPYENIDREVINLLK